MSLIVGTASGIKGREIFRLSGVFLFHPTMEVPTSVTSAPSSSLGEPGRSVMSSTWTSSRVWDGVGSSMSVSLINSSSLGFEIPFPTPYLYPTSPLYAMGSSSSTCVKLLEYGSEVVTSSRLMMGLGCILSLCL
jgi:hypothetical protein